jgi:glycosyltransferase involved in cell wall biosynthesis
MKVGHLLYVAWGFPPSRSGGVYRALATVNAFAENGWDVTVLTVSRELFLRSAGVDRGLEAKIHPNVTIERVEPDVPAYEYDLGKWTMTRARWPEFWMLADFRKDIFRFPELNEGRVRPLLESAAERIHGRKKVDLVLGTASPHVDFLPGWHLHRRFGVPHVMDYRDAWRLDVFTGRKPAMTIPTVASWERRLIKSSSEVWFVNEPIRAWHATEYPQQANRMYVVANGFDRYDAALQIPFAPRKGRPLTFGYIGTVSPKVPLERLIEGWRSARRGGGALADARLVIRGYLGYYGDADAKLKTLLERADEDGVEFGGPVSKAEIVDAYADFDALVLALGTGRFVTSGKVYEYAATGLPIVSVHDPGNAATDVLRDSPAWVQSRSLEVADIAVAIRQTAEMARSETAETRVVAQNWAQQYERARQLEPRIDALADLVSSRRSFGR